NDSFDYIYSRFTIHSINYEQEKNTMDWVKRHLNPGGLLLLEVRSIKDELFQEGTIVEDQDNAKITDHYRRFIRFDRLKQDIEKLGFDIIFSQESQGLAPYKDEDPMVIRIIAKKNTSVI
ncbi:MAG: methyltransferase domain-containing protein, partial [Bacteroidales bacterium]|nr:methyltransferase domain-containing protein [Bacteroidales bacterium]